MNPQNTFVRNPANLLWLVPVFSLLMSCAGLRQAELAAGSDPEKAVAEVSQLMKSIQQKQVDLLAYQEYTAGRLRLADAQEGLHQGDAAPDIVENAAIAKALFEDAEKIAVTREPSARRILAARGDALAAGARSSSPLLTDLIGIDDELRDESKLFSRALSPEDFSRFQKKYFKLEVKAVQQRELDGARDAITTAADNDAGELAAITLRTARLDYETAMNTIAQSPRSPELYRQSVEVALTSATQLFDVMNVIMGSKGTPENIAVQIVNQKRALGELNTNVGKLQANLISAEQTLREKQGELQRSEGVIKTQEEQLARASTQVRFQQAMDEAQKVLSADDALVYQQGNNLVFRLKRINFPSGTAEIPEASKFLISRVDEIIRKLDADLVIVQGHTDSVGSAEINQKLSTARATAVANYLFNLRSNYQIQYAGYGESHPIAPNNTAEGRAMNRRVDLVVSVKP